MKLLQKEPGRIVALESSGSVVRKTYVGDRPDLLCAVAAREFDRLSVFHDALTGCPGATCPKPLEVVFGAAPYIRMTRAAGVALEDHLNRERWSPGDYDQAGDILRRAVVTYVRLFDEPYWDFIMRNFVYDPETRLITFLDFEIPPAYRTRMRELSRFSGLDFSVGALVAATVFEARRPKRMYRRRGHRQAASLARAVLERFRESREAPAPDRLREVAHLAYRLSADGGGPVRRAWYRGLAPLTTDPGRAIDRILDPAGPVGS